MEKYLGYINNVFFGINNDFSNHIILLFDLRYGITESSSGYMSSYKYVVDVDNENNIDVYKNFIKYIHKILMQSHKNSLDELVGVPVEVSIENHLLKDFRILTEVIKK